MNFQQSVTTCMRKYATFGGRASRSEYWWFFLFVVLIYLVALFSGETAEIIALLVLLLPILAVNFRRLHDVGRSGWWYWMPPALTAAGDILTWRIGRGIAIIDIFVFLGLFSLAILFYWMVSPGDTGANRYGEPPVLSPNGETHELE